MSRRSPSTAQVESIVFGLFEQAKFVRESPRDNELSSSSRAVVLVLDSLSQGFAESLVLELSKELGQECIYKEVPDCPSCSTDLEKEPSVHYQTSLQSYNSSVSVEPGPQQNTLHEPPVVGLLQLFPNRETAYRYILQARHLQNRWGAADAASFMDNLIQLGSHNTSRLLADPKLCDGFRTAFDIGNRNPSTSNVPPQPVLMPPPTRSAALNNAGPVRPLPRQDLPIPADLTNILPPNDAARAVKVPCSFVDCGSLYMTERGLREHMTLKHSINVEEASIRAEAVFENERQNTSIQATLPAISTYAHQDQLLGQTGDGNLQDYHQSDYQEFVDLSSLDNQEHDTSIRPVPVDGNSISPFSLPQPLAEGPFVFE